MYGVPSDLDLSRFEGATLGFVTLAKFQIAFHFDPHAVLTVEGKWCLLDSAGRVLDQSTDSGERDAYRVHRCIGERVTAALAEPPESVALTFESGCTLRVTDSSREYESFHIEPGDIHI